MLLSGERDNEKLLTDAEAFGQASKSVEFSARSSPDVLEKDPSAKHPLNSFVLIAPSLT